MKPIIKTKDLSVTYNLGKSNENTAIKNIDIEIYPGEYVVFFGPSGCGKSTLLYCISGMETPTTGEVFVKGNKLSEADSNKMVDLRRKGTGMIFQAYNLIPTLKILDNVLLPCFLGGTDSKETHKKAEDLLERFDIGDLKNRYPSELSGGQKQRVAIARSLIYDPEILLADEPVGNLDSQSATNVMKLLAEINKKEGKTVILVTHQSMYLDYAHRIFHMKDGQITRITTNSKIKQIIPGKESLLSEELGKTERAYPFLSEIKIKAKVLTSHLVVSMNSSEIERMEELIQKRILKELTKNELIYMFNKSFKENGLGLYKQTAEKYVEEIEKIINKSEFIEEKKENKKEEPLKDEDKKVIELRKYLLDSSSIDFKKKEEIVRLDHFIRLRINKKIDKLKFQKYLDKPFKKGGVGLNARTAKNFAQDLELILKY